MALEKISGATYTGMMKPEQRISNPNRQEQIPNISFSEKPVLEITLSNSQVGNSQESEKTATNSQNKIKNAINEANNKLKFTRTKCEFTYYEDINRVAIKVVDRDTEEVIREIPPEETLELVQKLWEFAGLLYDEKR
jgi:flagellar protein FlaG